VGETKHHGPNSTGGRLLERCSGMESNVRHGMPCSTLVAILIAFANNLGKGIVGSGWPEPAKGLGSQRTSNGLVGRMALRCHIVSKTSPSVDYAELEFPPASRRIRRVLS
jgi:hypothetical protein